MGRKRILYVTRPLAGGMLTHLRSLLDFFSDSWDVGLAAPAFPFSPELMEKIRYFPFPLQDGLKPLRDLHVLMRLMQICREARPDLLHIHGYRAAMVGIPAARFFHCPALVTVHNFLSYPAKSIIPGHLFPRVVKFLDPAVTYYIAVSEALRRELAGYGIPLSKISKIYNGIDPRPFAVKACGDARGSGSCREKALAPLLNWDGIRVGAAGRLVYGKGFDLFIRAAARVSGDLRGAGFFLAGEGPEREQLAHLGVTLGMEKRLFLLGEVKAMPDFLSSLDIFVQASRSEGLSITLLEAGAAGVSRLASATGGIPEVVSHGKTGLLFPPGDIAVLARELIWLALHPQERARLGHGAAREIAGAFSEKEMLGETEKVYESILLRNEKAIRAGGAEAGVH